MEWRRCDPGTAGDPPPAARSGHVAVAIDATATWGTELLVVHGGIGEDKHALRDVCVMEAGDAHWFRPSPASNSGPAARAFHAAAALGTTLFAHGGHVYVKEKKGLHKFDDLWALETDTWEWRLVELGGGGVRPPARDFAKLTALPGGRLLLFGGLDGAEKRLDDAWLFDAATRTWSEVRAGGMKPKPRYGHGLALLGGPGVDPPADPRALVFAGETASGAVADLYVLWGLAAQSPGGNARAAQPVWTPLEASGTPPTPRKGHAVAGTARGVVVACGHTATVGWLRSRTDTFHSDVHLLEAAPPPAAAAAGGAAGGPPGGLRWVALSAGSSGEASAAAPAGSATGPAPREYHTLTAFADGRLLLFGGGNGKEMYGDAWWLVLHGAATPQRAPQQAPQQSPAAPPQHAAAPAASAASAASSRPGSPAAAPAADAWQPPPQPPPQEPQQQQPQQPPQQPQHVPPQHRQQQAQAQSPGPRPAAGMPQKPATPAAPPKLPAAAAPAWWEHIASTARSWTPGGSGSSPAPGPPQRHTGTGGLSLLDQDSGIPVAEMDTATAEAVAAAAAAAELEALREGLGLPPDPPHPPPPPPAAEKDVALLELGSRALAAAGGGGPKPYAPKPPAAERVAAARSALCQTGVEALPMADLPALVADYQRLAAAAPLPASVSAGAAGAARFAHLAVNDLRLGELPQLLACYRQLLQPVTA